MKITTATTKSIMNKFAERVQKAFDESPSVVHEFTVRIELPKIDARNFSDSECDIQEFIEGKLDSCACGFRSITIEPV